MLQNYRYLLMFTPYIAIQVQNMERRSNLEIAKGSVFKTETKVFNSMGSTSPCRSTKSNENPLKWSSYSSRDSEKPQYLTTRSKILDDDPLRQEQNQSKANLQILIRQSLRRSLTTRRQNSKVDKDKPMTGGSWMYKEKVRRLSEGNADKSREDIFDLLSELEGKKCVISAVNKPKYQKFSSRIAKSKSLDQKSKAKVKQLKIETLLSDQLKEIEPKEPMVALGMAAKRDNFTNLQRFQQHYNNSGNKIAISTTQCLIFSQATSKKSFDPRLCIQTQTNFVRAKKKSKLLNKKVANLQKEQDEQAQKLGESRIFEFKNNISKNVSLQISNSHKRAQIGTVKPPQGGKKQQNLKIQGWQISSGWDNEPHF